MITFKVTLKDERELEIPLNVPENVFQPTGTSQLILEYLFDWIKKPGKTLDLGCGSGPIGITLGLHQKLVAPLYASDYSAAAVKTLQQNAHHHGLQVVAREGSLFAPWAGERFDLIVDDVAGISADVAAISPWYTNGVPCEAGRDGTGLINAILEQAPNHLNPQGSIVFPVLSLSNEKRILEQAAKSFAHVDLVAQKNFVLPASLTAKADVLKALNDEGAITVQQKFGLWTWTLKIYRAYSN